MLSTPDVVLNCKADLGEGPIWDPDSQTLYWVNILANELHIFDPASGKDRHIDCGQMVGTVVGRKSGGLMVAMTNGFASVNLETEEIRHIVDPENNPEARFNDGKCDPAGRFWAGSLPLSENVPEGSLYSLETDLSVKKRLSQITIANGIVWTSDHKTMYYIDTPTMKVDAYDYDIETGDLSNHRVAVTVPEEFGWPDGMAIDVEDKIWVGHWGGWQITRFDPLTGETLQVIKLPVAQVTACAFGGPDLNRLYITTAKTGLDAAALEKQPHAGNLFVIDVDVSGVPSDKFAGCGCPLSVCLLCAM